MVQTQISLDPPEMQNGILVTHPLIENLEQPEDTIIEVKAHFEYSTLSVYQDKTYTISDGGADSCILGKYAKVISYTGRYANLVGDDPSTTKTEKVPIVSAYIKAISSSIGLLPVLLKVNEAPYNGQCPITLLSKYQIREYGLVIDSVAKKTNPLLIYLIYKVPNASMSIHGYSLILRIGEDSWV